jgi:hypothetical protein
MASTYPMSRKLALFLGLVASAPAIAQFSAMGATGVIATPTADVEAPGRLGFSYSNLLPGGGKAAASSASETQTGALSRTETEGKSLSLGLGLFPGLEVFGSFKEFDAPSTSALGSLGPTGAEGNVAGSTASDTRVGRLVGLKYQLPFKNLPYNTRLALGITDLSNSNSPYHHSYGVASSTLGPVDLSLGWSRSNHSEAMNGGFGSVVVRLSDSTHALADHDGKTLRSGLRLVLPSLKALPDWQASVVATSEHYLLNVRYDLDGRSMRLATAPLTAIKPIDERAVSRGHEGSGKVPKDSKIAAQAILSEFHRQGFTQIRLGLDQDSKLVVTAEPTAWRKNRMDALGAALAAWYSAKGMDRTPVVLELTHLGMPVLRAETSGFCIAVFYEGRSQCELQDAVRLSLPARDEHIGPEPTNVAQGLGRTPELQHLHLELGPVTDLAAGSSYGLLEHSTGLALGLELPLRRGLMLQGQWVQELSKSENFDGQSSAFRQAGRGFKSGLDRLLVNYQQPFLNNTLWTELALGQHGYKLTGLLATASWAQPHGLLRLTAQLGQYESRKENSLGPSSSGDTSEELKPAVLSARVAVVPGRWALVATGGQFLNNDKGWRFESRHQFGNNTLSLYLHDTEAGNRWAPRPAQMVGVAFSFALGPSRSWSLPSQTGGGSSRFGLATVRASDRFTLAMQQEVNETPGAGELLSQGHGQLPPVFHGLLTDTLDHDRGDLSAMRANLYRARAVLRDLLNQ